MSKDGKLESRKGGKSEGPARILRFHFTDVSFRLWAIIFRILNCGFLLAEAVKTAQSPDDLSRIDANNFPIGKAILDDV